MKEKDEQKDVKFVVFESNNFYKKNVIEKCMNVKEKINELIEKKT